STARQGTSWTTRRSELAFKNRGFNLIRLADANAGGDYLAASSTPSYTLLCFSHLRWSFVLQRPQHLMSRFARAGRVIFWEEPEAEAADCEPVLAVRTCAETGVVVVTPLIPEDVQGPARDAALKTLLDGP